MNRIKELRKRDGINQQKLAEVLNVKRPAVSKYENGEIPLTDETIKILSEYFDVTTDYLLGRTDDPTPPGKKKDAQQRAPDDIELDSIEFALLGEVRELDEEDKEELLRDAKRFRELKELRRKQEQ